MQTVNIRQLKTNPSTALAAARVEDMVVVMNRDHPQALLIDLEQLGVPDLPAVRVALAVSLFRSAAVSAGFAARMARMPLTEMLTLLMRTSWLPAWPRAGSMWLRFRRLTTGHSTRGSMPLKPAPSKSQTTGERQETLFSWSWMTVQVGWKPRAVDMRSSARQR